jgi:glutamate racemase
MSDNRPIGIFDSGLGGLTVVKQIKKILPNEDLVYLGDTARVPYGTRSAETVQKFSLEDAEFLLRFNVKIIVIACNTASSLAGNYLKKKLDIPVFEVISEASEDAVKATKNKKIGVIGTRGTVGSGAYQRTLTDIDADVQVFSKACPLFVPFIEEGEIKSEALNLVAKDYLGELKKVGVDTLIMGCTHYPIIRDIIEENIDHHKVSLIDPGKSQAVSISDYLNEKYMLNDSGKTGSRKYYVTDMNSRFEDVAEMFLGDKIHGSLKKAVLQDAKEN